MCITFCKVRHNVRLITASFPGRYHQKAGKPGLWEPATLTHRLEPASPATLTRRVMKRYNLEASLRSVTDMRDNPKTINPNSNVARCRFSDLWSQSFISVNCIFTAFDPQWFTLPHYKSSGSVIQPSYVSTIDKCSVTCLQILNCVGYDWDLINNKCHTHANVIDFNAKQQTPLNADFVQRVLNMVPLGCASDWHGLQWNTTKLLNLCSFL